ncbi:MAG: AgmX/PglI C-terminal domain-containing protein [Leptospirales bacterium]
MNKENLKNYVLMIAALVIGALGYKILFEQKPVNPTYRQGGGKNGKMVSPYHDKQVKNTILKNRSDMITCYNAYIETDPKITDGPLKVDFEIDDDGDVINAEKIIGPFVDETFLTCVIDSVHKWKFPEPNIATPVYVEHTFTFKKRVTAK